MIGNKSFDIRTNKGGEVSLKEGGRHEFVAALDFASMYPYVAESFNIDSSAIVPNELIEQYKNCLKGEKVEIVKDLIGPNGRGRITLESGEIIEELFAEFKNNIDKIQNEMRIWNNCLELLIDSDFKDSDHYLSLNHQRMKLATIYPKAFSGFTYPKSITVVSRDDKPRIEDEVLLFPNIHDRVREVVKEYNETTLHKRKYNILIMLQNIIDKERWEVVIEEFQRLRKEGMIICGENSRNLKHAIEKHMLLEEPIAAIRETFDKCQRRRMNSKERAKDSNTMLRLEQEVLAVRFTLLKYMCLKPVALKSEELYDGSIHIAPFRDFERDDRSESSRTLIDRMLSNPFKVEISETERIPVWSKQSKRGEDRQILPSEHWALKEIYNHFLRAARNDVKKQLKQATTYVEKVRLNALQNAIKVLMNSEYGASGASFFPFFNPVIPSITTASARASIHFLTTLLEQPVLYVDERFLEDNEKLIEDLQQVGIIKNIQLVYEEERDKDFESEIVKRFSDIGIKVLKIEQPQYFNCLDRCRNDNYHIVIEILPSKVIYQDTDSNYYIIPNIYKHLLGNPLDEAQITYTPQGVKTVMNAMFKQNQLYILLVDLMINRPPGGVNFEHAFISCRHFNAKKKYYGIDYEDYMVGELPEEWKTQDGSWKIVPGKSTWCNPNGEFIEVDKRKLLDERMDYFNYAKSQNIKATGMDLARRDQYKFVNLFHLMVIQKDLQIMRFENGAWKPVERHSMYDLVFDILNSFENVWKILDYEPMTQIDYKIDDFVKTINNNPGKANTNIRELNERLTKCLRNDLLPVPFEKVEVVVLNPRSAADVQKYWINKAAETFTINCPRELIERYTKAFIIDKFSLRIDSDILIDNDMVIVKGVPIERKTEYLQYSSLEVLKEYVRDSDKTNVFDFSIDVPYDKLRDVWMEEADKSVAVILAKENKDKNGKRLFRKNEVIQYCQEMMPEIPIDNAVISILDMEYYKKRALKGLVGYLLEECKGKELEAINNNEASDNEKIEAIRKLKESLILELVKTYRNDLLNSKAYSRTRQRINRFNMGKFKQYKYYPEQFAYIALKWNLVKVSDGNVVIEGLEKDIEEIDVWTVICLAVEERIERTKAELTEMFAKFKTLEDTLLCNRRIDRNDFLKLIIQMNDKLNLYESLQGMNKEFEKPETFDKEIIKHVVKGSSFKEIFKIETDLSDVLKKRWYEKPPRGHIERYEAYLDRIHWLGKSLKSCENEIKKLFIGNCEDLAKLLREIDDLKNCLLMYAQLKQWK